MPKKLQACNKKREADRLRIVPVGCYWVQRLGKSGQACDNGLLVVQIQGGCLLLGFSVARW